MIRRLAAGAAAALVLTGIPATAAVAGAGGGAASPVQVMHITSHGVTATVTVHGGWKLAHVNLPSTRLPHIRVKHSSQVFSDAWGGYADTGHNVAFRFAAANFTAPNVSCSRSTPGSSGVADVAGWTGLDGYNSSTVEQAGFAEVCDTSQSPEQSYYGWYEVYPQQSVAFTGMQPGDALAASVYYNSGTRNYTLSLDDLTEGAGFVVAAGCGAASCANSSAEVISEVSDGGPPAGYNLADYGAMAFTNVAVTARDGLRGNLGANKLWSPNNIETVGASDVMQTAGPLQGGTAFLETWKASS